MSERWYPYPIIFGKISGDNWYPNIHLRQFNGEQVAYSSNNHNLFLNSVDFEDDTFTISRFLLLHHQDDIMIPAPIVHCIECSTNNKVPCLLFMNPAGISGSDIDIDASYEEKLKARIINEKQIDNAIMSCSKIKWLISLTETKCETDFLLNYFRWALLCVIFHPYFSSKTALELVDESIRDFSEAVGLGAQEIGDKNWNFWVRIQFLKKLTIPLPIPQILINHISTPKLPPGHPDKLFFKENMSRADFAMFNHGKKHIIEIDGLSHFKDEASYVRNLLIDRSLKRDGWIVHRFGNLEIKEGTSNIDFILNELNMFDHYL
jgi:hypothetical protein